MNKFFILFILTLTFKCFPDSAAYGQGGSINDFDGDGATDIYQIQEVANGNISWYLRGSDNQTVTNEGVFGKKNNQIFIADWAGQPSFTKVTKTNSAIVWSAQRLSNGADLGSFSLGSPSSFLIAGGDFDGSLTPDAVAVRKVGSKFKWTIKYDPFSDGSALVEELTFGDSSGQVSYLDLDGDGDWLVVASKNDSGATYSVRARNPTTDEIRVIQIGGEAGRPQPLADPSGKDVMLFASISLSKTTIKFRDRNGEVFRAPFIVNSPGSNDGQVIVGDYNPNDPGEEVGIKSGTSLVMYNPFSDTTTTITGIEYGPVDSFFVGSLSGDNCSKLQLPDGLFGSLWKPNSDTQYFAVFVAASKYTGKTAGVAIYNAITDRKIKNLNYKGKGNPDLNGVDRENWQDYSMTGSMYKNQYGSIKLRMNLKNGTCISGIIANPSLRVD